MSLAVMLIIFGASSLVYTGYYYQQYIFSPSTKFPESVAKQLRKALYYTNTRPDAKQALGYYKKALEVADEEGMSPVSDEVLGIKIQIAQMFENQQLHENAIKVLETMMQDLRKWLELYGDSPDLVADRTRLLAKSVSISVTLGRLYAGEYVKQPAKAEEALVWAVETALKESKRRQDEGIKENEGPWLSDEEMGGSLECPSSFYPFSRPSTLTPLTALATHFESRDLHYLAAPLYLQCLTLIPPRSCHRITLMANLSASLAQQIPPPLPNEPPASREALVGAAQQWAEKAIEMSKQIGPTDRDDECDVACAVALHHLAGFAERDGRIEDARASYQQSALLSRKIGFDEGWTQAAKGLQALGNGTGS
jgi:tetratricopeptide (TPR) repeat protein